MSDEDSGWIVEYGYDENGNIATYLYYDIDGELRFRSELTYMSAEAPSDRIDAIKHDQEDRLIEWIGYQ